MKVMTCPMCHRVITVPRERKTCSPKCAQAYIKARDPKKYSEQRHAAGKVRGERSREQSVAFWAKRYPGVDVRVVRRIVGAGYHAGWVQGQRTGFNQGYAAAEAAMRMRRSA